MLVAFIGRNCLPLKLVAFIGRKCLPLKTNTGLITLVQVMAVIRLSWAQIVRAIQ